MMHIILCHGWGYSPALWQPLMKALADYRHQQPYRFYPVDLGYFSSAPRSTPVFTFPEPGPIIGIGHSLGFSYLLRLPYTYDHLICIQGFTSFLGYHDLDLRTQRLHELNQLKQLWQRSPEHALRHFYHRSKDRSAVVEMPLHKEHLGQDLDSLYQDMPILEPDKLTVLGSEDDVIITPQLLHNNFNRSKIILHPQAGHKLPAVDPHFVIEHCRVL